MPKKRIDALKIKSDGLTMVRMWLTSSISDHPRRLRSLRVRSSSCVHAKTCTYSKDSYCQSQKQSNAISSVKRFDAWKEKAECENDQANESAVRHLRKLTACDLAHDLPEVNEYILSMKGAVIAFRYMKTTYKKQKQLLFLS